MKSMWRWGTLILLCNFVHVWLRPMMREVSGGNLPPYVDQNHASGRCRRGSSPAILSIKSSEQGESLPLLPPKSKPRKASLKTVIATLCCCCRREKK